MKVLFFLLAIAGSLSVNAQFFKKAALPTESEKATHRLGTAAPTALTKNFFKPIVDVTATVSTGASLAGGFGVAFLHDKFDTPSNSWVIQYSVSLLGFIGTNGKQITGTAGLAVGIPGTAGIIQLGPGYDFTQQQFVLLTGVGINF
ncbi:MAG TPA: hypothetical protein VGZ90_13390 [Puia sp.]|jgi:hypothetical protein|nr:hypothetical protein [Puia sp.]